jgi:hypothetical protein
MKIARTISSKQTVQRGAAAVEFAFVAMVFFLLIFGIIELARIFYMYNTLADVTRSVAREAANISWTDGAALDRAKQRAIFRDAEGTLAFGEPITDRHILVDYLYLTQPTGPIVMSPVPSNLMPNCPARNRHNCLTAPYGDMAGAGEACIRLVRARICKPNSACEPVPYQSLLSFVPFKLTLPTSTTVVSAETLGYRPGDSVCL